VRTAILIVFPIICFFWGLNPAMAEKNLIYGKIYTDDDEILEGFIRWDKNEATWDDILDGDKDREDRRRSKARRYRDKSDDDDDDVVIEENRVSIFGITIFSEGGFSSQSSSGIRMGHIQTLIPDGDDEVQLILKSGDKIYLEGGAGDIGEDNREILVDVKDEGIMELDWGDIEKIEFSQGPSEASRLGKRLFGKVVTSRGDEFTGFIGWDIDEAFDTDILDGNEKEKKRKIEFGRIAMIERRTSQSALVTLEGGRKMRLDGTNDVDNSNRGIVISDLKLGRVVVGWNDFDYLEFMDPPRGPEYGEFDGGGKIKGKIFTEDGETYSGFIIWDNDESYTWELLDGKIDDVNFSIEFSFIKAIEKDRRSSSLVTLRDGREFRLEDSNDVDYSNNGIIVTRDDGKEIEIDWDDFKRAEF